jgi:hypothetical protein
VTLVREQSLLIGSCDDHDLKIRMNQHERSKNHMMFQWLDEHTRLERVRLGDLVGTGELRIPQR